MANPAMVSVPGAPGLAGRGAPRHSAIVRVTHWITTVCFFALLVTGIEIVISHPRFYWGEAGTIHMPALFQIPIPASRHSVPTGYGFVLPDQNGWSRSLHFQAGWLVVFTGLVYVLAGVWTRHFQTHLLPAGQELSGRGLAAAIRDHLRLKIVKHAEADSYNTLQRLTYLLVVFVLFPLMIWTGLAMSPAVASAFPLTVTVFGGQQSARTVHFFATLGLVAFLLVHLAMVSVAGFKRSTGAMITGRSSLRKTHQ